MYLIDTNTFSEARRGTGVGVAARTWMESGVPESIHMSVVTDYELEVGVLGLQRRDPRQARALRRWLDALRLGLGSRILPISPQIARTCAALNVPGRRPWADALIAATALHHGLTLVTRNERDFDIPGLAVINPFTGSQAPDPSTLET